MTKPQISEIEIEIDESRLEWDEISDIAGILFDLDGSCPGGLRWAESA